MQDGDNTSDLQVQSLSLNGGAIKDPGGQDAGLSRAATDLHLVIDTAAPTVSVAASATALLAGQTSTVTFTFSEAVTGFALSDTTVSGGALSNLVHVGLNASHQDIYTATFTPDVTNAEAGVGAGQCVELYRQRGKCRRGEQHGEFHRRHARRQRCWSPPITTR